MILRLLFAVVLLSACSTQIGKDGRSTTTVDGRYLLKTEIDRVADTTRRDVVDGLLRIADKLYRRNPREWKQAGQPSREAAVQRLRQRMAVEWPELAGKRERLAAAQAFNEEFTGDRVAALMLGLLTMVDTAFEGKDDFYLLDSLDEIKLYNAARNMEIAIWKLSQDRWKSGEQAGRLFLISNELDAANANLSFEREFGRCIGLLDLMAQIVADRSGRTLSRVTQSVATMVFLPVGF
ncbi:hypothetical protein [Azonexus hydrophilus]|uniref:hypothetical protein n=1 Tax=Azonexus hydrophilus TaxID=418702 RepID=UPI0019639A9B|nr:hypothetical protein [Azonexus hydrophilus]MBP8022732.1 hypothetical protein [Azonexus sp.]